MENCCEFWIGVPRELLCADDLVLIADSEQELVLKLMTGNYCGSSAVYKIAVIWS